MNEMVKSKIDERKNSIYNAYEIENQELLNKVEEYFKRLEEFASKYDNALDFEAVFSSSPMNQEYTDIFTEVSLNCPPKTTETKKEETKENKPKKSFFDMFKKKDK